jgi:2-polyprenyl-3-methyl-5-hydroxy-6-metoxy-1,4-benzoquinol methylase
MKNNYQYDYANISESVESLYDTKSREIKANKTILILKNYLSDVSNLKLLDIGCSTGIMTKEYAKHFSEVIGVDIDSKAIGYASKKYKLDNLTFKETPIEENTFNDQIFDVITCSHIYEHVPSDVNLMDQVFRLLKPGGVCYFAAGNRFQILEPHYRLPFLSYFPKRISNTYIRLFTKEKYYYETHRSYRNLKKLVNKFEIIDYTLEVLKHPTKYSASELLKENSIKFYFINSIAKILYFLIPTYIWILKKPE